MTRTTPIEGEVTNRLRAEKFEYKWNIQNWMGVQQSKDLLEAQKFSIDTGNTKWEIGLMAHPVKENEFYFYWKFVLGYGTQKELKFSMKVQYFYNHGNQLSTLFEKDGFIKVSQLCMAERPNNMRWNLPGEYWRSMLDSNGSLCFLINLTLVIQYTSVSTPIRNAIPETFSSRLSTKMKSNLAAAVNDPSLSDLKIVTSDKKELAANSFILKIQCHVFASMLSSEFSESTTGIVNVEDISGKTMEILLHFFYTGDLLPTWCDADTIVEFTYAAGKYQLTDILEMLDSVLGTTDKQETSEFDVALMSLANKLELKNAEARLLERVKIMTLNLTSAEQFLGLFDNGNVVVCGDCGKRAKLD